VVVPLNSCLQLAFLRPFFLLDLLSGPRVLRTFLDRLRECVLSICNSVMRLNVSVMK
jgi:hypothetical protein